MKNKEEFKNRLKDSEFLKLFSGATSSNDIAKIAQEQGYDVTAEDVENTPLSDDMLESVAGGKKDKIVYNYHYYYNNKPQQPR